MEYINKTIKDLEECLSASCRGYKPKVYCPHRDEEWDIMRDALKLLKEQEAVEPNVTSAEQRCGNCNKVIEMDGWKSCPWCGKPIAWSEWWNKNGERSVK